MFPPYVGCGGNLTGSYGTFTSPAYPAPAPDNSTCVWLITSLPRYLLTLEFEDFNVVNTGGTQEGVCLENYVQLYNGNSDSAPLVGTYCGQVGAPGGGLCSNWWATSQLGRLEVYMELHSGVPSDICFVFIFLLTWFALMTQQQSELLTILWKK